MSALRYLRVPASGSRARLLLAALAAVAAMLVCGAGTAVAAGASPSLYVADEAAGSVSVIDTGTGAVTPIMVGSLPQAVAISPDGAFAYVTNQGSGSVSVIETAGDKVVESITVGKNTDSQPEGIAISPDGSALYVTYGYRPETEVGPGEVAVIGTAVPRQVLRRIPVGDAPTGIAVTPDGTKAFVADFGSGQITEIKGIDGAKPEARPPIQVGGTPTGVAVTPDGSTVYVTNGNTDKISVLDAVNGTLTRSLSDQSFAAPQGIATDPAGGGAYVADFDGGALTALGAAGDVLGTAPVAADPFGVVYAPGGRTVYATSSNPTGEGVVTAIDAANRTVIGSPVHVDDVPLGLAITPDQAPRAAFTFTAASAKNPTLFDASGSTVQYGEIVSYAWEFGDGTSTTTTSKEVEHVYAAPGVYRVTLTVTDSAGTSTARVFTGQTVSRNGGPNATTSRSVTIVEPRAIASPSPTALDFGTQVISQLYLSKPVTLTDTGDAPLQVASVGLSGGGARNFAIDDDHCSGQTLAPGTGCIVEVLFLPNSTGAKAATLQFSDDAADSPQSVSLAGVGVGPTIALSPTRLEFPEQRLGTDSAPLTLQVSNESGVPLQVESVAPAGKDAGEFAVVGEDCTAAPVEPGHSCGIEVTFRPGSFGARNALVQIEDDALGSPHVAAVVGTGVGSRTALSPGRLSFGTQALGTDTPPQAVSVTNTGDAPLHLVRPLLEGSGAAAFALVGDDCSGQAVAPGATCTFEVAFRPAAAGGYDAELSVEDDGVGTGPSVALDGTATAPATKAPPAGAGTGAGGGGGAPPVHAAGRPRVQVRAARAVASRRARLVGSVDPDGATTTWRFQWGRTRRYGRLTAPRSAAGLGSRAIGIAIAGLRPGTTYHYRLVAISAAGTTRSRDRTFRTRE